MQSEYDLSKKKKKRNISLTLPLCVYYYTDALRKQW